MLFYFETLPVPMNLSRRRYLTTQAAAMFFLFGYWWCVHFSKEFRSYLLDFAPRLFKFIQFYIRWIYSSESQQRQHYPNWTNHHGEIRVHKKNIAAGLWTLLFIYSQRTPHIWAHWGTLGLWETKCHRPPLLTTPEIVRFELSVV